MGALIRCISLGLLSIALAAGRAQASAPSAEAQQLFDEARAALEAERYAEACPKLERSQALEPQLGTLLHLGHCYEKSGRLEDAWNHFQEALRVAVERRRLGRPDAREATAQRRAAALEPRIAIVTLVLAEPERTDLSIEHDARPLPRERWTRRWAVAPGSHRLIVRAADGPAWTHDYVVDAPRPIQIDVPAMVSSKAPALEPVEPARSVVEPIDPGGAPQRAEDGIDGRRIAAYALGGAGIVAAGFATGFFVAAQSARDEQDPIFAACQRSAATCDRNRNNELENEVQSNATRARVALAIGGAMLTGAVVLWLIAPERDESPPVAVGVEPGGAFVWVRGPKF